MTGFPHIVRLSELRDQVGLHSAFAELLEVHEGRTKDGAAFLDLRLRDTSRTMMGKLWSDSGEAIERARQLPRGAAVKVLFEPRLYRDQLQLQIKNVRLVNESDAAHFDPAMVFGDGRDVAAGLSFETLVFDIETVPAVETRRLPPTIAGALAKAAERADGDESRVMSLSPWFGKVISLAVADGELGPDGPVTVFAVPPSDRELPPVPGILWRTEPELLRAFWWMASRARQVVTYNGRDFDVPFLIARSLVHGLPATVDSLSGPAFALHPHLDLYTLLHSRRNGPGSLDVVCWALGLASPKGTMDGLMVAAAYGRGEIEAIAGYNAGDVRATVAVYERVREGWLRFRSDW